MGVGGGGAGICDARLGAIAAAGSGLSLRGGVSAGIWGAGEGALVAIQGSVKGLDDLLSGTLGSVGGGGGAMDADEGSDVGIGRGYVWGLPACGRITMTDSVTVSAGVVTVSCIKI